MTIDALSSWLIVYMMDRYLLLDETQALWRAHRTLRDVVGGHVHVLMASLVRRGVCERPSASPQNMGEIYRHVLAGDYMLCLSRGIPRQIRDAFHVTYVATKEGPRRAKRHFDAIVHPNPSNPSSVSVIDTVHDDPKRRRLLYSNVKRNPIDDRFMFLRWHV